jgi:hypothetical protein
MTYEEELLALTETRSNLITLIGSLTTNAKPNYDIDGQKISWGDYLAQLQKALKGVDEQILQLDSAEEESQGYC